MQIRQSFGANGKINACRTASRSQTKEKPPVVEKRAGSPQATRDAQAPGGQLPIGSSR